MNKNLFVIGLMSGTSMDGIDGTVLKTNGTTFDRTEVQASVKYQKSTKSLLLEAQDNPIKFIKNKYKLKVINKLVTLDHINLVREIITKSTIKPDLIGFHGQTVYHSFKEKKSIQLGDPQIFSNIVKLPVIGQFRQNDIDNGGNGAPLSPVYHMAIAKKLYLELPVSFINIGGVANITYYDNENLIGFDTGPGNGLMDFFIQRKLKEDYDTDGILAARGIVNTKILNELKSNIFFKKKFPKSLDKLFFLDYLDNFLKGSNSNEDILATLLEFTASTIANAFNFLPRNPKYVILFGGGQFNKHLVKKLKEYISTNIFLSNEFNLNGQYIEAELFSYLAARTKYNLPITYPCTTGVRKPLVGGKIYLPNN